MIAFRTAGAAGLIALSACQQPSPIGPAGDHYRIIAIPNDRPLLIDTETGKTWEGVRVSNRNNRLVWVYVNRLDDPAAIKEFAAGAELPTSMSLYFDKDGKPVTK